MISGAINNSEKGLKIPPVKYKRIPNCMVSNDKK